MPSAEFLAHPKRVFVVVGADTGVGKTRVGCGLARAWSDLGVHVIAVKPVESGCDGSVVEDGVALARAARQDSPSHALRRFRTPVAAPQAAEAEGETLNFETLVAATRDAIAGAEVALVETAGGLLSPFTAETTALELATALDAQLVVVSADRLGTQNHTRLTLRALAGRPIAAVVLSSATRPGDASIGRNAEILGDDVARLGLTLDLLPPVATTEAAAAALFPLASRLLEVT